MHKVFLLCLLGVSWSTVQASGKKQQQLHRQKRKKDTFRCKRLKAEQKKQKKKVSHTLRLRKCEFSAQESFSPADACTALVGLCVAAPFYVFPLLLAIES